MDSFIVDKFAIELRHSSAGVAVDGEIMTMVTPLEYRIARDAITIVVPAGGQLTQEKTGQD